jgi:hypothetical protein
MPFPSKISGKYIFLCRDIHGAKLCKTEKQQSINTIPAACVLLLHSFGSGAVMIEKAAPALGCLNNKYAN